MPNEDWSKPEVNRHSVWKSYVDQFEGGHAAGLLQESGQNSFDAYGAEVPPKFMKVVVRYDADSRVLRWRDFDTRGMPHCKECEWGKKADGKACVNEDCPWGAFHNMGYSAKAARLPSVLEGWGNLSFSWLAIGPSSGRRCPAVAPWRVNGNEQKIGNGGTRHLSPSSYRPRERRLRSMMSKRRYTGNSSTSTGLCASFKKDGSDCSSGGRT